VDDEEGAVVVSEFIICICPDLLKLKGCSLSEGIVGFRPEVFTEMLLFIRCSSASIV
jgi:hypothetical protein